MRCDASAGSFFVGRVPAAGRRRRKKRFSSLCRGVPSEPRTDFIEVVCTEHIGRKTGCLPLKRGIGPGRLSVVAVRRGRLDEPCRAAAQRGIPRAGGPHLRAAGAPLDGRRRRRSATRRRRPSCAVRWAAFHRTAVGLSVRGKRGCVMKRCRRRTAASWARRLCGPGRLLRSPVLDALAEGAEILSGRGCRGGLRPRRTRLRFGGCGRPGCAGRALRRSPASCSATGAADGRRPDRSHFFSGCGYLAESGEIRACAMWRHRPEWAEKRLSTSFLRSALGRGSNGCTNEEGLSAVCRTAPLRADSAAARRPRSVQCEAVFRAVSPGPISRSSA